MVYFALMYSYTRFSAYHLYLSTMMCLELLDSKILFLYTFHLKKYLKMKLSIVYSVD